MEAGEVGGIFAFDPSRDREDRLFHNAEFRVGHLNFSSDRNLIACTTTHRTGVSNIAIMPINGLRPKEVTEGDLIDWAPRWIPGKAKALVYQSAGIGRSQDGYIHERAPFTIEKLDFDRQEVVTIAQDPKSDLLAPQMSHDGLLYYIRRPYRVRRQFKKAEGNTPSASKNHLGTNINAAYCAPFLPESGVIPTLAN